MQNGKKLIHIGLGALAMAITHSQAMPLTVIQTMNLSQNNITLHCSGPYNAETTMEKNAYTVFSINERMGSIKPEKSICFLLNTTTHRPIIRKSEINFKDLGETVKQKARSVQIYAQGNVCKLKKNESCVLNVQSMFVAAIVR